MAKKTSKTGSRKGKTQARVPKESDPLARAISVPIVVLKVALEGDKAIWRRIAFRGDQSLDDVHDAIYRAFDRFDEHLYSFYFPTPGSKGRARVRNAVEYACPQISEDPDSFFDVRPRNAAEALLLTLALKPRQVFLYMFDYGDEWWHDITVEQVDATAERDKYPKILEKHGKSPPQYDYDE